jgi:uncharacterized cupredoxin-like copper-binding protein
MFSERRPAAIATASKPRRRRRLLRNPGAASALAAALTLAACGGSSHTGSTAQTTSSAESAASGKSGQPAAAGRGASSKLALSANSSGQLRFDATTLQGRAGSISIAMHNPSQLSHSIAIEGNGVNTAGQVVGPGGTSTVSATLKPGIYTFFCAVPGHREAGMQGTLTVR